MGTAVIAVVAAVGIASQAQWSGTPAPARPANDVYRVDGEPPKRMTFGDQEYDLSKALPVQRAFTSADDRSLLLTVDDAAMPCESRLTARVLAQDRVRVEIGMYLYTPDGASVDQECRADSSRRHRLDLGAPLAGRSVTDGPFPFEPLFLNPRGDAGS